MASQNKGGRPTRRARKEAKEMQLLNEVVNGINII